MWKSLNREGILCVWIERETEMGKIISKVLSLISPKKELKESSDDQKCSLPIYDLVWKAIKLII